MTGFYNHLETRRTACGIVAVYRTFGPDSQKARVQIPLASEHTFSRFYTTVEKKWEIASKYLIPASIAPRLYARDFDIFLMK